MNNRGIWVAEPDCLLLFMVVGGEIAASSASIAAVVPFVFVTIRAFVPEIVIGHGEDHAVIVCGAPAVPFAGGGASLEEGASEELGVSVEAGSESNEVESVVCSMILLADGES